MGFTADTDPVMEILHASGPDHPGLCHRLVHPVPVRPAKRYRGYRLGLGYVVLCGWLILTRPVSPVFC